MLLGANFVMKDVHTAMRCDTKGACTVTECDGHDRNIRRGRSNWPSSPHLWSSASNKSSELLSSLAPILPKYIGKDLITCRRAVSWSCRQYACCLTAIPRVYRKPHPVERESELREADRVIGLLWFVRAILVSPFRSKARLEAEIAMLLATADRVAAEEPGQGSADQWLLLFFVQLYRWLDCTRRARASPNSAHWDLRSHPYPRWTSSSVRPDHTG